MGMKSALTGGIVAKDGISLEPENQRDWYQGLVVRRNAARRGVADFLAAGE
jgi:hypothetical protein